MSIKQNQAGPYGQNAISKNIPTQAHGGAIIESSKGAKATVFKVQIYSTELSQLLARTNPLFV